MWHVHVSLTTRLIVVMIAGAVLVAKYRKGSHSTPADHSNLPASPAYIPQKTNNFRLNRAYRCFAFLGLITLPVGLAALLDALVRLDEVRHGDNRRGFERSWANADTV